jgi:hypothetical protein
VVAQYQVLANYFGALVILSDSLSTFGFSDFGLGFLLLAANFVLLLLCGFWCYERYQFEVELESWRKELTVEEEELLRKIMYGEDISNSSSINGSSGSSSGVSEINLKVGKMNENDMSLDGRSMEILKQYLLKPSTIKLTKKVGAGAFGEVNIYIR